jgi:hypothetical protein
VSSASKPSLFGEECQRMSEREEVARLCARIQHGDLVRDAEFDSWLPDFALSSSTTHWTPLQVAIRAARWLESHGVRNVLDVGSGIGKFCVAGALSTKMSFHGIEQRRRLVEGSRELATRFRVHDRVHFEHGNLDDGLPGKADGLYFYNPFEENLVAPAMWIDDSVEHSRANFRVSVERAEHLLHDARVGTLVVTYNGLGGRIPGNFRLCRARQAGSNVLRLWRKTDKPKSKDYWVELDDATILRSDESSMRLVCSVSSSKV